MRATRFALATILTLAACDGSYEGFLDSVPQAASPSSEHPIEVILGIDGLSRAAFDGARARGAFATYHDADLISVFPATSDYAWTRILRAPALGGYEVEYFDVSRNAIVNDGLTGMIKHPFYGGLAWTLPCYQRFDYLGNGETWMANVYLDPEGSLPGILDDLFAAVATRARQQDHFFGFILNLDVLGHTAKLDRAVAALVEIDRRIQDFKSRHPGRYNFTVFGDHGNTHQPAELVDPAEILRAQGVTAVDSLGSDGALEAVPVVHVRISYLALHTHASRVADVAERVSADARVDVTVAALERASATRAGRYVVYRRGEPLTFSRTVDGSNTIDRPTDWATLGIALPASDGPLVLSDAQTLQLTARTPYPDIFYRVATAFENPAAANKADVFISFPDNWVSFGFHIPLLGDEMSSDGFHGSLTPGSSHSVLATEGRPLPSVLREDDMLDVFPELRP